MPMIELSLPAGALASEARDSLVDDLTAILLRHERAPDNEITRAISWAYVDERPLYVGGRPAEAPHVKVKLTVPQFALDDDRKAGVVAAVTERMLDALGDPDAAARVWVMIDEVTDGNWGGNGRIFRFRDIATLVNGGREPARAEVVAAAR